MAKVVKSCHQLTWSQKKHDQRERGSIETNSISLSNEFGANISRSLVKRRVKSWKLSFHICCLRSS